MNHNMKHKICIAIALLTFASCMKVKKKGDDEPSAVVTANPSGPEVEQNEILEINTATVLSYQYINTGSELPQVKFRMPVDWGTDVVYDKSYEDKKNSGVVKFEAPGIWVDSLISNGKTTYKFSKKIDGQFFLLEEVEVMPVFALDVTEDLNLAQKFNLSEKTKVIFISDLRIDTKAHLYFENFTGQVVIQKVIANGGTIQTYPNDARAMNDVHGLSGGSLKIDILNGAGLLNVVMKGQNGGNGSTAQLPDETKRGADGVAASYGPTGIGFSGGAITFTCGEVISATDAENGKQGFPGKDGKDGGNSGTALVHNLSTSLEVVISSVAGKKGFESVGGAGGAGGKPGAGLPTTNCPGAPESRPGGPGIQGEPGHEGNDGQLQKSCLIGPDQVKRCINDLK